MVKIKTLLETWTANEYNMEAIGNEYRRLYNAIWALYENGLITNEKRDAEHKKLNIAYNVMETKFAEI